MFIDITYFIYSLWQINRCLTRGINSVKICKHHFTSPVRALIVPKINDSGCHAELIVVVSSWWVQGVNENDNTHSLSLQLTTDIFS